MLVLSGIYVAGVHISAVTDQPVLAGKTGQQSYLNLIIYKHNNAPVATLPLQVDVATSGH